MIHNVSTYRSHSASRRRKTQDNIEEVYGNLSFENEEMLT